MTPISFKVKKQNLEQHLKKKLSESSQSYSRFENIDGRHPWQEVMKDHVVLYPVRELNKGKVTYFNYRLAKEMGLISFDHPNVMNKELEKKIIKTFSLQIINEFEQQQNIQYPPGIIKKYPYMATRYLQLQHDSRTGKTSGDGRSIWNGCVHHNGKIWDISSRGTGVTKLAPGAVQANKFLRTGDGDFGYGCGQMEIDELYATAISSEIFHFNKIPTERVLAIVDLGKGVAIGVRAAPNLIRPAHLFIFLKQNNHENLKKSLDYFIERQIKNKEWIFVSGKNKYDQFLDYLVKNFAKFIARLEVDYIFAWLDWDGDNVLANAGIIDYGSIRQFGVRHDEYRYDDVDRFSTNLNEQKIKARQILQYFAQIVDFVKIGKKKNIHDFKNHTALIKFDELFRYHYLWQRLYNLGFNKHDADHLMKNEFTLVKEFEKHFKFFESIKTNRKQEKVADGVNRPAIFNMRDLMRELPKKIVDKDKFVDTKILFAIMISTNASSRDCKFKDTYEQKLLELQKNYYQLIEKARGRRSFERILKNVAERSAIINRADRATGNAIIVIVDKILSNIRSGLDIANIQEVIEAYVKSQLMTPEVGPANLADILKKRKLQTKKLLHKLFLITTDLKDEI